MPVPTILQKILDTKALEVEAGRAWISSEELAVRCTDMPPVRGFRKSLEAHAHQELPSTPLADGVGPNTDVLRELATNTFPARGQAQCVAFEQCFHELSRLIGDILEIGRFSEQDGISVIASDRNGLGSRRIDSA